MKFNISNMTVALAAAALGAASCTANYEDINRNPYEVTAEDMERDGYAMRSFMTTMQSWVIPADVNQCQFTDLLLGGPYGGYIADANSGFNTGKFSTYDPQSNWSPVFYRVIYTNEMSNFTELCKVTEDENAIAVAKVVKVAGVHRVADTYGPIPYTQVGTGSGCCRRGAYAQPCRHDHHRCRPALRRQSGALGPSGQLAQVASCDAYRLYGFHHR